MEVLTKEEASAMGLKRYFTGKPCKKGHIVERNLQSQCLECRRLQKLVHNKTYRKKNKGAIQAYRKKYNKENRESTIRYARGWRKRNPLSCMARLTLQRIEKCIDREILSKSSIKCGYSQEEFKGHIEGLWLEGMTWQNRSEWHIDHIKPMG